MLFGSLIGVAMIERRQTRSISVGGVLIGSDHQVSVQSMTKTPTEDLDATVAQIRSLAEAGCDIVRVAVPNFKSARLLGRIKAASPIPVVADIHFNYRLAIEAIKRGVDAVRINPGNIADPEALISVARAAKSRGLPIRIGVNSGSILRKGEKVSSKAEMTRLMVSRALEAVRLFEKQKFFDLKLSLKASDILTTMEANRKIALLTDYPLHIGTTATGPLQEATVKSAVVIGGLLSEGIGDTIRVSLTAPPEEEVRVGLSILEALGLRRRSTHIISCPTCGRCRIDLVSLVEEVQRRLSELPGGLEIAVMGCSVNGPGEARSADIGIAAGRGYGFLFKRGRRIAKVPEKNLVDALFQEAAKLLQEGERSS